MVEEKERAQHTAPQGWLFSKQARQRWEIILLAAILALATGLRFYHLGAKGLWADEIFTAIFAAQENSLADVVRGSLSTPIPAPPLWFLITHLFAHLPGSEEFVMRLPAAIAGVLGVWTTYEAGRTLFDRRAGLTGALLLALSPLHLYVSQEARYYAGVVLFSVLGLVFLERGIDSGERRWWVGFALATLVNVYTHLTAFFVLASEVVYACLLLLGKMYAAWKEGRFDRSTLWGLRGTFAGPLVASLVAVALAYAPMVPYVLEGMEGARGLGGAGGVEGLDLSAGGLLSLFGGFGSGTGLALSLYTAAAVWGLGTLLRKSWRRALLVVLWIALPFAIVVLLQPRHWFNAKYVIAILPVYLLAVAVGLTHLARTIVEALGPVMKVDWAVVLVLLVAIYGASSVPALGQVYHWEVSRWREVGELIEENAHPNDAVVPVSLVFMTMPAEQIMAYYGPTDAEIDVVSVRSAEDLAAVLADHRRVWIVVDRYAREEAVQAMQAWLGSQPMIDVALGRDTSVWYTGPAQTSATLSAEASQFEIPNR